MHELFLTAVVPEADLDRAQALLQGLTGMTAYATLHRVLYFTGPPKPRGLTSKRMIPPPTAPLQARSWMELHQQLSRQSYVLQIRYPVTRAAFGVAVLESDPGKIWGRLQSTPGTLRWTDIPDPIPGGVAAGTGGAASGGANTSVASILSSRLLLQREKIEIAETRNLPAVLQDNQHRFKSELVEESFVFFADQTEYILVRYHRLPPSTNNTPLAAMPSWEEVVHSTGADLQCDPAGQWLLLVRRHVLDDTSPDKMNSAVEALERVRMQLAGVFSFRSVDRRAHDTRLERQINNMPAPLPQRVRT